MSPRGPFIDCGVDLTPHERFAIDPHPFVDHGGTRYLYYARNVLEHPRPGTQLAVARMRSLVELEEIATAVLAPNADWQRYEKDRPMYGRRLDWHTLEYHAWDAAGQRRQVHLRQVIWQEDRPVVGGATDHDLRGV